MVGVFARKHKLGFQGHTVGETAAETLLDGVARRVDVIIEKFELEVIAGVSNREVLGKDFEESLIISFFRRGVELEEVAERLELHLKEVGIRIWILNRRKVNTGF